MNFASDNWSGVHPEISERMLKESTGYAPAYGNSDLDKYIEHYFNEIFEREVAVFFVATGTAANALALASINKPGGVTFCHTESHMLDDECGAPEFFASGARLSPVEGTQGKISPENLVKEIERFPRDFIHAGQPMAVSITQATEIGTSYSIEEIKNISDVCKQHNIPLHMDGARFANALTFLNVTPSQLTWKAGIDILSFGATKNGCWCAEALIFMHPEQTNDFPYIRKRSGQLFSKTRFISSQFAAYFENDLWLRLAQHSNLMAQYLGDGIEKSADARLAWATESNEVFCIVRQLTAEKLQKQNVIFHQWNQPRAYPNLLSKDEVILRMVCSFETNQKMIDQFLQLIN